MVGKRVIALSKMMLAAAALSGVALLANGVDAQPKSGASTTSKADQDKAQAHFKKAREHYSAGRYRAAITELEAAHALDPSGAELVYNLGLVHEKLGDIDDAIRYYRQYVQMTDDESEKERIGGVLRRLEGAREEVVVPASSAASSTSSAPPPELPGNAPPPEKGRMDGWVIGTASIAAAALVAGGYFGYKAWNDRVDDPPTTGPARSFASLQDQADKAHREAVFADVGFGVAIVAGATSAILYFARDAKPAEPAPGADTQARWAPAISIVRGGATAGVGVGF